MPGAAFLFEEPRALPFEAEGADRTIYETDSNEVLFCKIELLHPLDFPKG